MNESRPPVLHRGIHVQATNARILADMSTGVGLRGSFHFCELWAPPEMMCMCYELPLCEIGFLNPDLAR